eukprot:CAMPEP_0116118850 /NCGR_PEP_ID=MMETSP0329-20121206/2328_1 /TAXON_ID=697910 /ORGANISM="Pseudo-nitzschia arenysensis, Strain B593" /LENGTH=182 /DNA_ID=CAMNT_0003612513 /DNA_START=552 /DNA_END=1101 /DNA_ORIENTATION=-
MDHQPERVEEKDPLVKASAETEPPKLFWYELGAAICGVSFLVHVYILRKKLGSTTTTRDSGGAYKPIAMNGGEAELTKFGSKNDLDAEYGDGDESDDDEDLGSPESFGMEPNDDTKNFSRRITRSTITASSYCVFSLTPKWKTVASFPLVGRLLSDNANTHTQGSSVLRTPLQLERCHVMVL